MKKSIIYILFALFSFSAAVSLTACKDDGVEISDAYKSKTPKNVKLLEYGNKSLTICWDFVRGATSYTVQLVDGDMNPVSEALCMTTADIDYHEFTDLPTDRIYYGRVRANYPYSATSDWVYVTEHDKPAMLMASVGILDLDPQLKLHAASGSTLTFEWSYTDDKATDAARSYNVELFRDEACTDLYVSWLADGKLSSGKGIFTALAGYPVVRYTFSGLDPETTYYARLFLKGNWAQDIVQDVFVNVWIRRETLDPRQSLYGYLLRSVYNQSVNYVNKNRHAGNYRSYHQERIESIGYAYYDPDNNPIIEKIYSQDLRAGIDAAVAALPEKCREVFTLSYLQGFSHREISERLGIAQSTVENHIYLALKALRSKLSKSELLMLLFFIFLCNNSQSFG